VPTIMFVRVKKIKGRPYAYLVENEWTPWGSRQKVTKYLGKTITPDRISEGLAPLPEGAQTAIIEAIAQELQNHGFRREEHEITKDDILINLKEGTIRQKKKKIVLGMNEGYMCDHTIKQLLEFKPEENPNQSAKKLVSLVLEAGLNLSDEQFVHIFEQVKGI